MSEKDRRDERHSTSEQLPHKPTKASATASSNRDEALGQPENLGGGESVENTAARREVDAEGSNAKHPPHVTENDEDAPVQDDIIAPNDVPVLPANASGSDTAPTNAQDQTIDDESMYDDRPGRDKDQPPSHRVG